MGETEALLLRAQAAIAAAESDVQLDQARAAFLGKKGELRAALSRLGSLSPEARRQEGEKLNAAKETIESWLRERRESLAREAAQKELLRGLDVTLPGRGVKGAGLHPLTLAMERVLAIFRAAGFSVEEGPEIEDEYFNFTALNMPPDHPARLMHDTFYLEGESLLRTHTSPVQVRHLQKTPPPVRMVAPGRVFRRDFDLTHTPMFHQVEGLWVDEKASMADLRGVLEGFLRAFFEDDSLAVRLRPSFFPFTEPSAEVDIGCVHCQAKGCRICGHTGWLEVLGAGMVHPKVLEAAGVDPGCWQGFAFGLGVERLAMLYFSVPDIRLFFEGDMRFLSQFH